MSDVSARSLQVLMARPEDSGTYVCVAQNSQGTTETRVEVQVEGGPQVPMAPRATVQEPLMVVVDGQTAILRCHAQGMCTSSVFHNLKGTIRCQTCKKFVIMGECGDFSSILAYVHKWTLYIKQSFRRFWMELN